MDHFAYAKNLVKDMIQVRSHRWELQASRWIEMGGTKGKGKGKGFTKKREKQREKKRGRHRCTKKTSGGEK